MSSLRNAGPPPHPRSETAVALFERDCCPRREGRRVAGALERLATARSRTWALVSKHSGFLKQAGGWCSDRQEWSPENALLAPQLGRPPWATADRWTKAKMAGFWQKPVRQTRRFYQKGWTNEA